MQTSHCWAARCLVLLFLSACGTDQADPTPDSNSDGSDNAAVTDAATEAGVELSSLRGHHIRLFQSNCATRFAVTEFVPVIGPEGTPVLGPDGRPVPARFTVSISGQCSLRDLGAATLIGIQQVVFNSDGTQSLHNESRYTVAGGDVLYSISDGAGALSPTAPTTVTFEALERFTGGTGRFADARGGAKARGSADLTAAQGEYRALGVIGY